jgi:hypothetical protein
MKPSTLVAVKYWVAMDVTFVPGADDIGSLWDTRPNTRLVVERQDRLQ